MKIGEMNKVVVNKITDIAYMLFDGEEELFMHFNDAEMEYEVGDELDVFLFYDKQKRLAATSYKPFITINKPGLVEVLNTDHYLGAFVKNNITKDFLLSKDDINLEYDIWPQGGDKLFCILKLKNSGLVAKLLSKNDLKKYYGNNNVSYNIDDKVIGYVHNITDSGINIFSIDGISIFVHKTNLRDKYRLGQEVEVRIIHRNDNDYNGSLIERKEYMIDSDSKILLDKLNELKGQMPYTDKTDSETILKVFNMSKKAFKRALGHLYKERIIYFENNMTIRGKKNGK